MDFDWLRASMRCGKVVAKSVQAIATVGLVLCGAAHGAAANSDVSGVVRMPDVCSPAISPAVVYLTPAQTEGGIKSGQTRSRQPAPDQSPPAEVVLVNQHDLQFVPRVRAIALGQTVRFTNQDGETHNVHVVSPGYPFNQSMAPGQYRDFTPARPGVMRLACDVHMHMRGYVVVSPSHWAQVCDREGRYHLRDVPDGRYVLTAWHEMGDPVRTDVIVAGGGAKRFEVPDLVLASSLAPDRVAGRGGSARDSAPARPWADVIDQISVTLAASRDALARPGELARARRLAEDAYWGVFEASDMETAVRTYLGYARAGELERRFHTIRVAVRGVAEQRLAATELADLCHKLLVDLLAAARALDAKGVTDGSRIDSPFSRMGSDGMASVAEPVDAIGSAGDPMTMLHALKRGFHQIEQRAERDGPDEAASELTSVYMTDFEPLERYLFGRSPQAVRPLEVQFNTLRGELAAGLKGDQLTSRLDGLTAEIEALLERLRTRPAGAFGPAFVASLVTIVREGLEVILVVTMLLALVTKVSAGLASPQEAEPTGASASSRARARGSRAVWWGVGLASVASVATAVALNFLVLNAQGATREILEGLVMLVASGVLFYVSYWLISQLEARRWMDFLKKQARHGLELGGQGTLAVTAFLAVYREGAETSLMYQALLGSEGRTQAGFLGLAAGLALGIVVLAVIAVLIRATSVRLPVHLFFKGSGIFLYALAIMFAGNGVFELQNAGVLHTTNLAWMGNGLPWAGLYPNLQVVSVQGLLLAGAVLGWAAMIPRTALQSSPASGSAMSLAPKRG
jgi:high-affinity iron transporter